MEPSHNRLVMRTARNSILCNVMLAGLKLLAGLVAHSSAMLSDALDSLSDALSTVVVIMGVRLGARQPDKEHPYGHERFECVAAVILSAVLFATGAGIGWAAFNKVLSRGYGGIEPPGWLALCAPLVSIAVKEGMYRYTRAAAKKTRSGVLMADALHHRSDALSSVASFAGVLGARLGLPVLDPIAGMVICAFILKVALDIFRDAVGKMTDKACDDETTALMSALIMEQSAVEGIDQLKTRLFGERIYVDVEIRTDCASSLLEAHDTAQRVHDALEARFPHIKHCMVHVNPGAADGGA